MMNKKIFILMFCMALLLVPIISGTTTSYTSSLDKVCNNVDGKIVCTNTLYSGIRNVYEDDEWKRVENARSLVGSGIVPVILENDKDFPVEVVDYNYTSIKVNLNPKGFNIFVKDVPVRVWEVKDEDSKVGDFKNTYEKVVDEDISYWLLNQQETKTYDFGMDSILEFGYNSTTITLTLANGGTIGDTYVAQDNPSTNYASSNELYYDASPLANNILIKFNITSIPENIIITNAVLRLRGSDNKLEEGEYLNLSWYEVYNYPSYNISGQEWKQDETNWSNSPLESTQYNTTSEPNTNTTCYFGQSVSTERIIPLTNLVNKSYTNGADNFTVMSKVHLNVSGASDTCRFLSSRWGTSSQRPKLEITYIVGLGINITSPINQTYTTIPTTLNWTVGGDIEEFCWYSDDLGVSNTTVTCSDLSKALTFPQSSSTYFMWTNDSDNNILTSNVTFFVDSIDPSLTVDVAQSTLAGLQLIPYNISVNFTVIDTNLKSCWYNSTWSSAITNMTCNQNLTNISLSNYETDHIIYLYANDSLGNEKLTSKVVSIDAVEIAQYYLNSTTEGSIAPFQINLSINPLTVITIKDLFYNYTNMGAGTLTAIGGDNYSITKSIEIPVIAGGGVIDFYWNLSLDDGTIFQSVVRNQTIATISLDDCTIQGTLIFNYSLKDEETQSIVNINGNTLNSTIDLDVNFFTLNTNTLVVNYSKRYTNNTNPQICATDETLNNTQYSVDVVARYESTNYATEYSHIQSFTLTNNSFPQHINLFDLDSDDSTEFLITFKDATFALVDGALIDITRYYVDEGLFRTIEIPKTDSDGQAMGHFVQNDVIYTIIISKGGTILAVFDNKVAICADATIGDCQMNLNAFSTGIPSIDFETEYNLNFATTFDEDARRITTIFSTQDGSVSTVQLNATQFTGYGNTTVCSHLLTSSSGTLICDIPESFGNVTVIAELFSSNSPDRLIATYIFSVEEDALDIFGYTGIILVFILIVTLPFLLISSTIGMIIGVFIGLIIATLLNLYEGGGILGVGATVIWAIVAGGIIIWKIAQGRGE